WDRPSTAAVGVITAGGASEHRGTVISSLLANGPGSPAPNPRHAVNVEWVRPPVVPHQDDPLPQNVLGRTMWELVDRSRRTLERVDEATTAIGDLRVQVGLTQIHLDGMFNWMLEATIRLAQENTNLPGQEVPSPVLEAQDVYSVVPTPSDLSNPADTVSAEELLRSIKRLWLEMDLAGPVDGAGRMSVLRRYGELKELLDYYLGFLTQALANPGLDSLIVLGPVGRALVMAYDVVQEAMFLLEWLSKGRPGPDSTGPASPYSDLEMSGRDAIPSVLELQQAFGVAQGVGPGGQSQQGADALG
ncbi:hypothetical protein FRC10_006162, partial [Ceratobasidium sp. 414]